jgi:glutamine synthetase
LIEAIELTEESDLVREALGEHVFQGFIMSKKVEWDDYRMVIHPFEIEKFLPIL